jgi:methionine--tRNA ligase beta chain
METKPTINYKDFAKLDLRVAEIKKIEEIEGADKLYKLTISLGDEKRTICAGIKEYYTKEELQNKKIIIIANLEPRTLRGIESQGMLLAAENKETNQCILLTTDKNIESGTKIS